MANYEILSQPMGDDDIALKQYNPETYKPETSPYVDSIYSESPSVTQAKLNLQNQLNSGREQYQDTYSSK